MELQTALHWFRPDPHRRIDVASRARAGAWKGMLAGAGGVAVMTLGEKLEQRLTGRPDSFMPAHTLERLLGLRQRRDSREPTRIDRYLRLRGRMTEPPGSLRWQLYRELRAWDLPMAARLMF
jgi:hypothetical protein